MADPVETVVTTGGGHVSRWRNVIVEFPLNPSADSVRTLRRIVERWMGEGKAQFGVVVVLPAASRAAVGLDAHSRFRRELARFWDSMTPTIVANAFVVKEEGFAAATVRAFVTGVQLLTRGSRPRKVFSNVAEAAEWLEGHMAKAGVSYGSPAELTAVIQDLAAKRA
ncbi:MAG TPA: hypothetical protein VE093_07400 [Polyangiaceae bacterium]|nr:hypothetical protein [Polyangiaceae bacterium]